MYNILLTFLPSGGKFTKNVHWLIATFICTFIVLMVHSLTNNKNASKHHLYATFRQLQTGAIWRTLLGLYSIAKIQKTD